MLVAQHILHNTFGIVVSCGSATPTLVFQKTLVRFLVGFSFAHEQPIFFSRGRTCVHRLPYRAMKDCDLLHGVASLSVGEDIGSFQTLVVLAQNFCLLLTALPAVGIRPVILQGASLQALIVRLFKTFYCVSCAAFCEQKGGQTTLEFGFSIEETVFVMIIVCVNLVWQNLLYVVVFDKKEAKEKGPRFPEPLGCLCSVVTLTR